jgi:hypothetical protein
LIAVLLNALNELKSVKVMWWRNDVVLFTLEKFVSKIAAKPCKY